MDGAPSSARDAPGPSARRGPSGTRANRPRARRGRGPPGGDPRARRAKRARSPDADADADSTSDTGDEDRSPGSDDCCVYTYRGGERLAELRGSFRGLDVGPAAEPRLPAPPLFGPRREPPPEERAPSSPDMDYLEMDFDPGPSRDVDSGGDSAAEEAPPGPEPRPPGGATADGPEPIRGAPPPGGAAADAEEAIPARLRNGRRHREPRDRSPETEGPAEASRSRSPARRAADRPPADVRAYGSLIPHAKPSGEIVHVRRTSLVWPAREIRGHHNGSGDLVSPGESREGDPQDRLPRTIPGRGSPERAEANRVNHASALFHCTMAKRLVVEKQAAKFLQECDTSNIDGPASDGIGEPSIVPERTIWTEREACARQITQIGTSACGATAVMNALSALEVEFDAEAIASAVGTRLRANDSPLSAYVISRAIAGCGVDGLAAGLRAGSKGAVSSRFFSTWPERAISLSHWLSYWIELGCVPIVTLNLQSNVADVARVPDSWHHQMVFGAGPRGVYMTNPLECVEEGALWHHLCSDSILLIKRKDILSRWNRNADLTPLARVPGDERWKTMNVLGQIVSMIRESQNANGTVYASHVKIPACYSAGITIAAFTGSEAHERLSRAPELPLLMPEDE